MNFVRHIEGSAIVELRGETHGEALRELLLNCQFRGNVDDAVAELVSRESEFSSCVGNKIAVVGLRINMLAQCEVFVGWSANGVRFGPPKNADLVNVVALVLVSNHERDYRNIVIDGVNFFQRPSVVSRLQAAKSFDEFRTTLVNTAKKRDGGGGNGVRLRQDEALLRNAVEIARKARCSSVMLFGNVDVDDIDVEDIFVGIRLVHVVQNASAEDPIVHDSHIELRVGTAQANWSHGFRGAILFGITRNVVAYDEKICCIGYDSLSDMMDILSIVDVQKEFRPIFASNARFLQCNVKPEVLERVLSIASEIAIEGREGKAVGCMFVIGDINKISLFMKPLVLNPFCGYQESDRNVLNPFMGETIKEFSLIDGAFVIRGDGVIESAGTLIYTPSYNVVVPSGLGTRHAAAASISWAAECIAIAVSESTRAVTLFQNGQMLQITQK
jgi:DNA integrity scanning protein DisA with diadenylate cyclase activity/mannitol/fructose-specific phosphotransferase system IIA component (Ntr-type)